MMKKLRNRARPISTWFGGEVCVPSACRSSERTMMMRVKLVIISSAAGMKVSAVSVSSVCTDSV
ncbi:MAG: hypothetical protein AW12_02445 [Candidatus Accumulibacter sp. BA-94]|nr:MAG: hypothetical protein AW12_02445 [Candidatus Accumulibacter sp. BA-94]